MKIKKFTILLDLPCELKSRGKWFITSCKALDVHSQGETKEKAIENLNEALELFLSHYE